MIYTSKLPTRYSPQKAFPENKHFRRPSHQIYSSEGLPTIYTLQKAFPPDIHLRRRSLQISVQCTLGYRDYISFFEN